MHLWRRKQEQNDKTEELQKQIDQLARSVERDKRILRADIDQNYKELVELRDLIASNTEIGVDTAFREHPNWAVICINGKPEYVKFMELGKGELETLKSFLKRFSRAKYTIDAPPSIMRMFREEIL